MKTYKKIFALFMSAAIFISCSENDSLNEEALPSPDLLLKGVEVKMASRETPNEPGTKAINDFVVNKAADPTSVITTRTDWELDVQIYKGSQIYQYGSATLIWNSTNSRWQDPTDSLYFPNYTRQAVSATLHPEGWNNIISLEQRTDSALLVQDVLIQNGTSTIEIRPAHIPTIQMRHAHSMLDFILDDVNLNEITEINVHIGNDVYQPYPVTGTTNPEYLVIIPVGVQNPVIHLTTVQGANYEVQVDIQSTQVNTCYCIKLEGIELKLSSVTVSNWAYGEAIAGQYTTIASYPTFRGPASTSYTVYFVNGLSQVITFNDRGESTPKPLGRSIIRIQTPSGENIDLDTPLILNTMYVDLNPYL